jgi:HEPN domain-containing protein
VVCFHAQQAVEKLLKALLVFAGVPFARTPDVIQLVQLLPGDLAQAEVRHRAGRELPVRPCLMVE